MERWVEITFDCLPLRSVTRLDAPLDASPKYQEFCQRVNRAIEKHGVHNSYYLYNAHCVYRLLNHQDLGRLDFVFQGTAFTDELDVTCRNCDLEVRLFRETCDWLTQPIVNWFEDSVRRSVAIEFDRYISAGDLARTKERIARIQQQCEADGGYVGMYL